MVSKRDEVITMEGIILSLEALASPWSLIGGVSLLAIVVRAVGFGYIPLPGRPNPGPLPPSLPHHITFQLHQGFPPVNTIRVE